MFTMNNLGMDNTISTFILTYALPIEPLHIVQVTTPLVTNLTPLPIPPFTQRKRQ